MGYTDPRRMLTRMLELAYEEQWRDIEGSLIHDRNSEDELAAIAVLRRSINDMYDLNQQYEKFIIKLVHIGCKNHKEPLCRCISCQALEVLGEV